MERANKMIQRAENVLNITQTETGKWHINNKTKDYNTRHQALKEAMIIAKREGNTKIILKSHDGLIEKRDLQGKLDPKDYPNMSPEFKGELSHGCVIGKSECKFPDCRHEMACEKTAEELQKYLEKENYFEEPVPMTTESNVISEGDSVKKYFTYQEELNTLDDKTRKLKQAQENIFDKIKTDIETVFLAFEYDSINLKIELTEKGLKIIYPAKIYNDFEIIPPINTDLFTKLNELMGVTGMMNIENKTVLAGNHVYTIELIYDLEQK